MSDAKITYVTHDGVSTVVQADVGLSVMEAAVKHGIGGIVAECGGSCACATCMVYVDAQWQSRLPPKEETEASMLEFLARARDNSRLSCQLPITDALDGLVVHLPEAQG